ncbi:MAG: 3-hydroxyacyl-CoA dehydrogenase NAD-binding domain-containing protein [Gammaproteobacteria bacterium]|nr:3-hydroxyacyl-CoA dehydrogenase NAD-binding domain-containing protein [Gammaproteobacteria bacterium]
MKNLEKIAVIGAGTMGSGIAGQIANSGRKVLLIDMCADEDHPNAFAEAGYRRLLNPKQPGLIHPDAGHRIRLGNLRDHFEELSNYDWVAEAVVERLEIKQEIYHRLNAVTNDKTIITSNTSTIPIRLLTEGLPESFCRRFAVTHFFNPVRFMRLLELVGSDRTDPEILDRLEDFCDRALGKGVIRCGDTPGFLANRIGVYSLQLALFKALELNLPAGEADAIFGRPMAFPKTGVFGLYDLIGIDLMADVVKSLKQILPGNDAFHAVSAELPLIASMIKNQQTGNKKGKGFYKVGENGDRYELNHRSQQYEPYAKPSIAIAAQAERASLKALLEDDSLYGQYAWQVLSEVLVYSASLIPEVTDDLVAIDDAMKLGYNWVNGPFEMLDMLGVDYVASRLESQGRLVPDFMEKGRKAGFYALRGNRLSTLQTNANHAAIQRPEGVLRFSEVRRQIKPQQATESASWYEHDGIVVVEFHSKANVLNQDSMNILADALQNVSPRGNKGLIVHNDAQHFSCGVDLSRVREFFDKDDLDGLDSFLKHFQETVMALKNANFPVVVAPVGMSIGGGYEVVLHSAEVICHANSVMGLVESGVGLIASGGGCKETLYRWVEKLNCENEIDDACWKAFMNLGYGATTASPLLALEQAMLRENDRYEINRDRIYASAKESIVSGNNQKPLVRGNLKMPGKPLFDKMIDWLNEALAKGRLMSHDTAVATEIATIVTGGNIDPGRLFSEADFLEAERRSFLKLVQTRQTQERIVSLLDLGKALRN